MNKTSLKIVCCLMGKQIIPYQYSAAFEGMNCWRHFRLIQMETSLFISWLCIYILYFMVMYLYSCLLKNKLISFWYTMVLLINVQPPLQIKELLLISQSVLSIHKVQYSKKHIPWLKNWKFIPAICKDFLSTVKLFMPNLHLQISTDGS